LFALTRLRLPMAFIIAFSFTVLLALAVFSSTVDARQDEVTKEQTGAATTEETDSDGQTIMSMEPDEPTFCVRCDFSHRNSDDPIVYPGKKGAAHSHDFFGNRSTKYNSTYESLTNKKAKTTCTRPEDKASYWIPTVKWNGTNLTASRGIFYYRASLKDPATVKPHPAGLKVVPNTNVNWRCGVEGTYSSTPPTQCSNGQLDVRIIFPDCSNGQLDSADHRSHMTYAQLQSEGKRVCPDTHPTPVPALSAIISFPIPTSEGKVTLSSGEASTMHADFFNAWKQEELTRLVEHCINDYVTRQESDDPQRPEDCKVPR
jgi:hypothetical protein